MKNKIATQRDTLGPEQWGRLKDIVADALEQPSAAARAAFVAARCANDAALLAEAASLLKEAEQFIADPSDVFEECADHATARLWQDEPPRTGWRIGAYAVERELGRGGMGTVFLAARADGQFDKEVAIKVLKRGMDTDEVLRRFAAERHILARLDHPNIARLLDAGTTDDGLPYFVMEYVAGSPVTRFVRDHQLSIQQRLELFLKICVAVEVAHRNKVIHRDLKPTNILVTEEGEPKLLDFGIAKLLAPGDDCLDLTAAGEQRLTPTCASPEQADGRSSTTATDVYALGALLYEMLSGHKPHRFQNSHPSRDEIARVIRDQEPPAPSSVGPPEIVRHLRGDLDAIVLYALRKQPECRYAAAAEFAADVGRHLAHQPVLARQHSTSYRLKCLTARYRRRLPAMLGIVLAVSLAAASVALLLGWPERRAPRASVSASDVVAADAKSIAVLPFDNFAGDNSSSYFADGVQDNILTDLGKIGDLKVISRSGVSAFRGKARDMAQIGRQLGVANVLEGSVQTLGNRVRINAQLIDTRTNTQLWAEHYDRNIEDIFGLQSELAQTIAAQLNATLSAREKAAIWKRPTQDMQAYDLYLRARAAMNTADGNGGPRYWAEAVSLLGDAIARDPKFALAYSLLNEAHLYIYRYGNDHSPTRLAAAKEAADTALGLDPNLEEARLAVARYYYTGLNDYRRTEQELAKLGSSNAHGVEYFTLAALVERRLGLWSEAIRDSARAVELDPQDGMLPFNLVQTLNGLKRYAEAERVADAAIHRLAPNTVSRLYLLKNESEVARGDLSAAGLALDAASDKEGFEYQAAQLWLAYLRRDVAAAQEVERRAGSARDRTSFSLVLGSAARAAGDGDRAQAIFSETAQKATAGLQARPDDPEILMDRAVAYAGLGRNDEALQDARRATELRPVDSDAIAGPMIASMVAQTLAWTGDRDSALQMLARLVKLPFGPSYGDLKLNPAWDELRATPEFDRLLGEAAALLAQGDAVSEL